MEEIKMYKLYLSVNKKKGSENFDIGGHRVTSGYFCHTVNAILFPQPANMETVSQPVTTNQNGRILQTSSFGITTYLCTDNHLR